MKLSGIEAIPATWTSCSRYGWNNTGSL